jgi:hypothetical protein
VRLEDPQNNDFCSQNQDGTFNCSGKVSDNSEVILYLEEVVYPGDTIPSQLYCLEQCPDPSSLTGTNPYYNTEPYQDVSPSNATYQQYTFDTTNMVLQSGGTDVVLTTENSTYEWGIISGPLFEPTPPNLAALACDWDTTKTCGWQAWSELDTFYTWETGPNDWNMFTALKDSSGTFLTFEAPLQVEYSHTWDDGTTSKFYLEYSGFGELHGIPGICVDWNTGEPEDCDNTSRWVPEFSIPDGSEVTDSTNSYLVKALEKEQRMKSVDVSNCSGLSLTSYNLPSMDDWQDPAIGDEPTVTDPPAVIGGVVQ